MLYYTLVFLFISLVSCQPTPISGPLITPLPQTYTFGSGVIRLNTGFFDIAANIESDLLNNAILRYQKLFFPFGVGYPTNNPIATLNIKVSSDSEILQLYVSENYTISVEMVGQSPQLEIIADTIFGAMRALETFSQLISYDAQSQSYSIPFVPIYIDDFPRFPWRGLQIDTGRHFIPTSFLMHIIESCAYSKLNTLHWHVSDGESFPAESKSLPNITLGAFGPLAIYTIADMEEIVAYGLSWGVRVLPEFDVPAHSFSWSTAFPGIMANCPGDSDLDGWPLSPALPEAYDLISKIYTDMSEIFIDKYFHSGGDELPYACWDNDPVIANWMTQNNFSTTQAEQYFEDQITNILDGLQKTKVIWHDPFANGCEVRKDTVLQVWDNAQMAQQVVNAGIRAIVSYDWYLDMQIPVPGHTHYEYEDTWLDFYAADPLMGVTTNTELVIGGESCMWGEQVDHRNFDVRVWPRTIAIAERLWSNENVTDTNKALTRFDPFSCHISNRGINSGPLYPDYCLLTSDFSQYSHQPRFKLTKEQIKNIYNSQK
ncbi:hypothetical protein PPL_09211 [Heterostelium album PN500]|uniref:Beta-hexosaminidase n=1 Tax=Heterostelium pallidum (strain ATCC 26659 / Pp 5 / PN500) TaxID=670386 RepID=D3BKX9_HETP5|nr:hypothetical protein PPL_09211 [Heterostelium album PN500]EFA78559.1 hypothetical protein PPL_09211 [Heterostelium album PN500]|eukprot:XP_020430683.1 hypothetical protein PPL_09211 [Heterostelium album PN500]